MRKKVEAILPGFTGGLCETMSLISVETEAYLLSFEPMITLSEPLKKHQYT